ncbi:MULTISPECIES: hypothetical protein [unclassified Mesorhizobium]|uniref:hypothetical protein n=1 Tax=unclassified Mesorhizobium TaxID=325217 RepID=UPI00112653C8|nr:MULTISPECIES: hypothetical protein [unclassified Mesorhizobium]TPL42665.1 hypothetical protein FJ961_08215 [Mesorhizobium sp. B2-4-5]TPL66666.1 hypothetical protein FJ949_09885 [Mesorhizobium sp. B2-4-1]
MMTIREFSHKAEAISKASARYEQLHKALHWLDEHEKGNDIKPVFSGHIASCCTGYKELMELLGELSQSRMKDIIWEFKDFAAKQLMELDKKYG